jgi:predicted permease
LLIAPATSLSLPVARRDFTAVAAIVLAAFGSILMIACANVANVLLARGAARSREIAIRLAIGAKRGRLVQLLLTESAVIAVSGGVTGSLLAWWCFQALLPWLLSSVPGLSSPRLDAYPDLAALWFGVAITLATTLACGLPPALSASKQGLHSLMKDEGLERRGRRGWLRSSLVSVQVAVSMVLLIAAGLLVRALQTTYTIDPGFRSENVAVVSVDLRGPRYEDDRRVDVLRRQLIEKTEAVPGVVSVARVSKVPLSPGRIQSSYRLPQQEQTHEFDVNTVSPEYFSLLGIPIVSGRAFTEVELGRDAPVAIVTEATARRFWPGQDVVGRTIVPASNPQAGLEIVGVARDAHVSNVASTESSYLYLPATASAERRLTVLVRSMTEFDTLATTLRHELRTVDPTLLAQVYPLTANLEYWRKSSRAIAILSGSLGLLAVVLAAVGVYGIVAYVVARKRHEIGIRMTLGATPRAVQTMFLREMLLPVVIGVLIGAAGAAGASQVLESRLFGISRFDPVAYAGAAAFLIAVAGTAATLPTRRALKLDPVIVLRHQ